MFIPVLFIVLFIFWTFYHVFIKRDIKQHINDLYAGLTFTGLWAFIYFMLLK